MKKRFSILQLTVCLVVAVIMTFNLTFTVMNVNHNKEKAELLTGSGYLSALLTVDEIVRLNFSGDIDDDELKAAVIRGYLEGIGDEYSTYMTSVEYEIYNSEFLGSMVGIGVNLIYNSESTNIEVIEVSADSPAEEAGILVGDIVVAIEGKKIKEIGYYAAVDLIHGAAGTIVNITVARDGAEIVVPCVRADIDVLTVKYHVYTADNSIGVIRISSFYANTPREVKDAIEALKALGCTKFVFDLRYNGGGGLSSIISTLDYLLPKGKLVDVYYSTSDTTKTYSSDESFVDAKVAVLINGRTASAAELFAAAMRDFTDQGLYDATLVGTTTYGKGVFQTIYELSDGSAFRISCGRYDPPCGVNYDGIGVEPDFYAELSEESQKINFYKLTDENDDQLILAASILSSN